MIAETYSVDMRVDVHEDLTIDGKQIRLAASQNLLVLTCADCTNPSVVLYDKSMMVSDAADDPFGSCVEYQRSQRASLCEAWKRIMNLYSLQEL